MNVAVVTGGRDPKGLGLEQAEVCLLAAVAREGRTRIRVVGGRSAAAYARRLRSGGLTARWVPALPPRIHRLTWAGADLVHLAGLSLPPPKRTPFVVTVWDLAAVRFRDEGELPPWAPDMIRRARFVLTHSRFIADEVSSLFDIDPTRIRVVPHGPARDLGTVPPLTAAELGGLGIRGRFVLRTGGYTDRKHVDLLLTAWPHVRQRHPGTTLVLAGPAQPARRALLAAAPSLEGVHVLDFLPGALVGGLMRSAAAVASPSRYEGFGLPPLEAMTAGTPVVALRTAFAEEICGEAAVLVEDDPLAFAEGLHRVLSDQELGARLKASGLNQACLFTWAGAAGAIHHVYRSALAGRDELHDARAALA